jgi:hypothetical protein
VLHFEGRRALSLTTARSVLWAESAWISGHSCSCFGSCLSTNTPDLHLGQGHGQTRMSANGLSQGSRSMGICDT